MSTSLKKNKSNESLIDEYMNSITSNCENKMPVIKKLSKITDENISIPNLKNYNEILKYNYNLSQLKIIAKYYKLKISGNKNQMISRIYTFLYFSSFIVKIQKIFRGTLLVKNIKCYMVLHV